MTTNSSSPPIARRDFLKTAGVAAAASTLLPPATLLRAQDSPKPVVLALVGGAHIHTPGFINLLKARPDVQVKYVWDHDAARAERRARELPGSKVVADAREIWADPQVAAVVICSETNRHLELVNAAAAARKHLFVEKPLGISAADSRAMAAAIEQAGLLFTTGYFSRTNPQLIFLREQIAGGALGKVTRLRASNCHSGSLGRWFDTEWRWMADPKIAGVGAFGDLGTHALDIMLWLLGEVDLVTADIKVVVGNYGDCDEGGEALLQFRNGALGALAASWVDVADPVPYELCGTEGHATIFRGDLYFQSKQVEGADGKAPWKKLPPAPPAPLVQFIEAVAGKTGLPLVTPREAAARVSVMEAAYAASRTKTWVKPA
jgi:predicted dehydrogenase